MDRTQALKTVVIVAAVVVGMTASVGLTTGVPMSFSQDDTYPQAISYIAFCSQEDVNAADVSLEVFEDEDGEPGAVKYSPASLNSLDDLSTVVIKSSTRQTEILDPATSGTVTSDSGDPVVPSRPNGDPCPADERGVKFENYNSTSGTWDSEEV